MRTRRGAGGSATLSTSTGDSLTDTSCAWIDNEKPGRNRRGPDDGHEAGSQTVDALGPIWDHTSCARSHPEHVEHVEDVEHVERGGGRRTARHRS
jgi:hypothetical protein